MPKLFVDDGDRRLLLDLDLGESIEIGRSPAADLAVQAERASRHHCRIEARGDAHVVVDLSSRNGTRVDGAPLDGERVLADGTVIDVGGARIVYRQGA